MRRCFCRRLLDLSGSYSTTELPPAAGLDDFPVASFIWANAAEAILFFESGKLLFNRSCRNANGCRQFRDRHAWILRQHGQNFHIGFHRTFHRTFGQTTNCFALHRGGEKAAIAVIGKNDIGPIGECAFDARTDAVIWKNSLGNIRGQDGVANIRIAGADFFNRQVVRKVAGADDFNAVAENKEPYSTSSGSSLLY